MSELPGDTPIQIAVPGCRVHELLGEGGFGTIHSGTHERLDVAVAIKIARADIALGVAQARRELAALQRLQGPHVPTLYDHGQLPDGAPFLVMERIEWPTLEQHLTRYPRGMPMDVFRSYALALLDAVAAVHDAGLAHRDLKPENLFLGDDPVRAKVIDFGLAEVDTDAAPLGETLDADLFGSPVFMSPEHCSDDAIIDRRSDVYSLGVILYAMLTGKPPFAGQRAELYEAHRNRRPPRPSLARALPDALEQLVLASLAKRPEARPGSASALRQQIQASLADRAAEALPEPATPIPVDAAASSATSGRSRRARKSGSAKADRQRRLMVHLFFDHELDVTLIQDLLSSLGGHLAHIDGTRGCAVFRSVGGKQPMSHPLFAAETLLGQQLCPRVLLDLGPVVMRKRKNGAVRYRSGLFAHDASYPRATDPEGLMLTPGTAELVPELFLDPRPLRDGLQLYRPPSALATQFTNATTGNHQLFGREATVAELRNSARDALARQQTTLVTVIAEAGHGKSHLSQAMLAEIRALSVHPRLLELRIPEPVGANANEAQQALLLRLLDVPRTVDAEAVRARLVESLDPAHLEEAWPVIACSLGFLPRDAPEVRRIEAVPRALHDGLVRAMGTLFRRRAERHPLCVLIDDAQFADEVTLDAIEYAALEGDSGPLWICVLARPKLVADRPDWGREAAHHHRIELGPLDHASASALCRKLLLPAENIPAEAIDTLVERTRGIPLLLVELVRGLERDGLIRKHERGDMWYVATDELDRLPDLPLVEWLARRELESLPDDLANHVRLLALLGLDFSTGEIDGVTAILDRSGHAETFPLATDVVIRRLHKRRLLLARQRGRPADRIGFRHSLIRESLASSVPSALAEAVHKAAYRFYSDPDEPLAESRRLTRLAYHAARSGARAEAGTVYLELGQRAAGAHAYVQAERLYTQALELVDEKRSEQLFAGHRGRGAMRYRVGRYQDSLADLSRARELTRGLDVAAEIHVLLDAATAMDWTNEYRKSEELVTEASELAQQVSSPLIEARLLLGFGRSHFRFSRLDQARAALREAAERARELSDDGYETSVIALLLLTLVLPMQNEVEDAERMFEELVTLCEQRGDRMHLVTALVNRRVVCIARKQVQQAVEDGLRCIAVGRELGIPELGYVCEYNLGELLYLAGDLEAAWPHVHAAVTLESRRPSGAGRPLAELLEARLLAYENRMDELRERLQRLDRQQGLAREHDQAEALFLPYEQVLFDMLHMLCDGADHAAWVALRERAGEHAIEQEEIEVAEMHGLGLIRAGRLADGRAAIEEALALTERIPTIMDERLRHHL